MLKKVVTSNTTWVSLMKPQHDRKKGDTSNFKQWRMLFRIFPRNHATNQKDPFLRPIPRILSSLIIVPKSMKSISIALVAIMSIALHHQASAHLYEPHEEVCDTRRSSDSQGQMCRGWSSLWTLLANATLRAFKSSELKAVKEFFWDLQQIEKQSKISQKPCNHRSFNPKGSKLKILWVFKLQQLWLI